jgi:hypothetical protein
MTIYDQGGRIEYTYGQRVQRQLDYFQFVVLSFVFILDLRCFNVGSFNLP